MARRPNPKLREKRKMELIESIINIINENSISSTTTRKIANEAGLTIASLHYYFGSKDGAMVETAEYILESWIREVFEKPGDIEDMILDLFNPPDKMAAFSQIITYPYRSKVTLNNIQKVDEEFNSVIKDILRARGHDVDSSFTIADVIKTFLIGLGFKGYVYPEVINDEVKMVIEFLDLNKERE
ncbi:TetR/AcrR family transcriptional regulator [Geotoga petraea]|uniref:DNA-binding transcriptional regulator, AcrR family n=1 Tax=Geotoga petraea TaxID=28234 RepID=A0A1G6KPD5_9BACT|nr:TetR/AcrR family transcriptional regulator [Geotoga petraea]MDK2946674.1 TetR/AcrR family transcriptional regulator, regulator of cefoperazone and chloramphenicol [Geotoga sp.]SDC32803.1 DNA-binding transcriptional regulator, AcrR family [Geotoga petraea]